MTTATMTEVSKANFERLTASSYAHSMCAWGRLHFSESGKQRLAHTIGFIEGVHISNPERAYALADDLCRYLDYLSEYGGMLDSPEGRTNHEGAPLQFPRFRVSLGDDGGIGSFSVMWYYAIPHKTMMDTAQELADGIAQERYGRNYTSLKSEDSYPVWDAAIAAAKAKLRLVEELEVYKMFRHTWDTDNTYGYDREYVCYGFSHNGALIFHHDRDDISKGNWSTHT